jgi:hypothetical protein
MHINANICKDTQRWTGCINTLPFSKMKDAEQPDTKAYDLNSVHIRTTPMVMMLIPNA